MCTRERVCEGRNRWLLSSPGGDRKLEREVYSQRCAFQAAGALPINNYEPRNALKYNQGMEKVIGGRNGEHLPQQKTSRLHNSLKNMQAQLAGRKYTSMDHV